MLSRDVVGWIALISWSFSLQVFTDGVSDSDGPLPSMLIELEDCEGGGGLQQVPVPSGQRAGSGR